MMQRSLMIAVSSWQIPKFMKFMNNATGSRDCGFMANFKGYMRNLYYFKLVKLRYILCTFCSSHRDFLDNFNSAICYLAKTNNHFSVPSRIPSFFDMKCNKSIRVMIPLTTVFVSTLPGDFPLKHLCSVTTRTKGS